MDEIYIKGDLVMINMKDHLLSFVNVGDMNNQILEYEAIISNGESSPSLAKTMTMFMVKDLLHKFDYPYNISTVSLWKNKMGHIFDPMWEAFPRLERIGFLELALYCDGL